MRWNAEDNGSALDPAAAFDRLLLDGKVVPFEIAGSRAAGTRGHRFLGNEPFKVTGPAEYEKGLKQHKVMLDAASAAALINEQARALAKDAQARARRGRRAAGRERRPHRMADRADGRFDKAFLDVPAECLMTSMKTHQKCFSLRTRTGKLANPSCWSPT